MLATSWTRFRRMARSPIARSRAARLWTPSWSRALAIATAIWSANAPASSRSSRGQARGLQVVQDEEADGLVAEDDRHEADGLDALGDVGLPDGPVRRLVRADDPDAPLADRPQALRAARLGELGDGVAHRARSARDAPRGSAGCGPGCMSHRPLSSLPNRAAASSRTDSKTVWRSSLPLISEAIRRSAWARVTSPSTWRGRMRPGIGGQEPVEVGPGIRHSPRPVSVRGPRTATSRPLAHQARTVPGRTPARTDASAAVSLAASRCRSNATTKVCSEPPRASGTMDERRARRLARRRPGIEPR